MPAYTHPFTPQPWMTDGLCTQTDPEMFFPETSAAGTKAKRICRECPVVTACLEYALAGNDRGIWGGTSAEERVYIRRERKATAA